MNLVSIVSNALVSSSVSSKSAQPIKSATVNGNPFANPFVSDYNSGHSRNFYGKNNPVKGGYFAGYYNGKPNIVGQRLFLEV